VRMLNFFCCYCLSYALSPLKTGTARSHSGLVGFDSGPPDTSPSYSSNGYEAGVRFLAGTPPLRTSPGADLIGSAFLPAVVASRGALSVLTYGPIAARGSDLFGAHAQGRNPSSGGSMAWDMAQLELEAPHFVHSTASRTCVLKDSNGRGGAGYGSGSAAVNSYMNDDEEDEEDEDEEDDDALLHGGMAEQASRKRTAHSATRKPKTPRTNENQRQRNDSTSTLSASPDLVAPAAKACRILEVKAFALLARLLSAKALAPWRDANLTGLLDQIPSVSETGSCVLV